MGFSETGKTLDPISIIRKDAITEGVNPDSLIIAVNKFIQDPHYNLVQFNNTLFLLHLTAPYTVEINLFSADNIMGIMSALKQMIQMLKNQGFKKLIGHTDESIYKTTVERSKLPFKITQTVQQMGDEMKPVYRFEMDL